MQNTAEQLTGDPVLNQVRFNARLFAVWLKHPDAPVPWTPKHLWMYKRPPDVPPDKSIDLRTLAQPHCLVVRFWGVPRPLGLSVIYAVLLVFAITGQSSVEAIHSVIRTDNGSSLSEAPSISVASTTSSYLPGRPTSPPTIK